MVADSLLGQLHLGAGATSSPGRRLRQVRTTRIRDRCKYRPKDDVWLAGRSCHRQVHQTTARYCPIASVQANDRFHAAVRVIVHGVADRFIGRLAGTLAHNLTRHSDSVVGSIEVV